MSSGCLFRIDASSCRRGSPPVLLAFSHCFLCLVLGLVSCLHLSLSPRPRSATPLELPSVPPPQCLSFILSVVSSVASWFYSDRMSPIITAPPRLAVCSIVSRAMSIVIHVQVARVIALQKGYTKYSAKRNKQQQKCMGVKLRCTVQ